MSYAEAAGSGTSSGSQHRFQHGPQQNSKGRFYDEKMVVCMSNGISYEQLADELYNKGFWKSVTGLQRVDFDRRFAIVIEDAGIRDKLVERGLEINGKHIIFGYHRRRVYVDLTTRVNVSQLPIGIIVPELEEVSGFYGSFLE